MPNLQMIYTKQEARTLAKTARTALNTDTVKKNSQAIFQTVYAVPEYQNCGTVLTYADCNGEFATIEFITKCLTDGKLVALPRIEGKRLMRFYYISSLDDLKEGAYHILEPQGTECCKPGDDTIMIMPGVAYDNACHRVGYGGGYYDTYLAQYPHIFKIGVCHSVQLFDHIQTEAYDICPDVVITENKTIYKNTCI
jgi:5-formyltetrahydrofolate cyclo-ligase